MAKDKIIETSFEEKQIMLDSVSIEGVEDVPKDLSDEVVTTESNEDVQDSISEIVTVEDNKGDVLIPESVKEVSVKDKEGEKGKENISKTDVKIRILLPVAGLFLLPYNVGQEVEINKNQAEEMVALKYAEYINK